MLKPTQHSQTDLFQLALGLSEPWQVIEITFCEEQGRLDIHLSYSKGTNSPVPSVSRS